MRVCRFITLLLVLSWPAVPQATPDQAVIQGGTHVVLVNVVAKDKHGKPVADLGRNDFVLRDNGQEQKIALFALEEARETATAVPSSPARLTFNNRPGPGIAAVTVFLFDELNTKLTDQELAKKDFPRYLRGLPADSRVAVFALGDSLAMLHDFSEDMASLLAALAKHKNPGNPGVGAAPAPPSSANSLVGDQATTAQWDKFMQSSNQPYVDYAETVRATRTAAALETIAGHLQGIPGRKTLIWISGGFPIQLGLHNSVDSIPQSNTNARSGGSGGKGGGGGAGGKGGGRSGGGSASTSLGSNSSTANLATTELPGTGQSFESDVARAIRALNEADVAVYPVDARGVTVAAAFQADRSSMGKQSKPAKAFSGPDFNYETLETLAVETGGQAFHHINDLSTAIREAAGEARVSYSLAFSPPAGSLDDTYHRLEVTVKRPDVKLRYRPGYVGARGGRGSGAGRGDRESCGAGRHRFHRASGSGGGGLQGFHDHRRAQHHAPTQGREVDQLAAVLVVVGKVEQLTTIPLSFTEATFHQIQEKGLVLGARVRTPPGTTGFSMGFRDIPSGMVGTSHVPM